jgi:hypothetical protein
MAGDQPITDWKFRNPKLKKAQTGDIWHHPDRQTSKGIEIH